VLRSLAFGSSLLTLRLLTLLDALLLLIALCSTTNRRLLLARLLSPPSTVIIFRASATISVLFLTEFSRSSHRMSGFGPVIN
jgi:hypothetical protein